jgi:hypothetical protein
MIKVTIAGNKLIIDIQGLHKIWALKSRVEIPVEHIASVRGAADEPMRGIRFPGTFIPGTIMAGTYYERGGKRVFWDVCDHVRAIAIELRDENFSTMIIEVPDPRASIREILNALGSWTIANV